MCGPVRPCDQPKLELTLELSFTLYKISSYESVQKKLFGRIFHEGVPPPYPDFTEKIISFPQHLILDKNE